MSNITRFPNKPVTVRTDALQLQHPINGIAGLNDLGRFVKKRKLLNVIYSFLTNHETFSDRDIDRELVVIEDGTPAYVTVVVLLNNGKIGYVDEYKTYHVSEEPINAQIILTAVRNCS